MNNTLLELKKLREVLDRLKEENTARESERQALLQENNAMTEKVSHLECALKEQRMLISEKEQVLDKTQEDLLEVKSRLQAQVCYPFAVVTEFLLLWICSYLGELRFWRCSWLLKL